MKPAKRRRGKPARRRGYSFQELSVMPARELARVMGTTEAWVRRQRDLRDRIEAQIRAGRIAFRKKHPRYDELWSLREDRQLQEIMHRTLAAGWQPRDAQRFAAAQLGRNHGGIEARLRILAVVDRRVDLYVARRMRGSRA